MVGNFAAEISNSEEGLRAFVIQDFDFWNAAIAAILAEAQEKGEIPTTHNIDSSLRVPRTSVDQRTLLPSSSVPRKLGS
jgi:hypothetical protein